MDTGGGLERLMERLYRRTGRYYLHALLALVAATVVLVVVPVYVVIFWPTWRGDVDQLLRVLAVYEAGILLGGVPVMFWTVWRRHRVLIRYLAGDTGVEPSAVWMSAVGDLPRTIAILVCWYSLCALPGLANASAANDFSAAAVLAYVVAVLFLIAGAGASVALLLEFAARPIVRGLAPSLPPGFPEAGRGVPLGLKLLVVLAAMCLFTGIAVGGVAAAAGGPEETMIVTVVATLGISATLAAALIFMLRHSILVRVQELRRALEAIRHGDAGVRLPPLGGDELDEVGRAFNEMVDRLERHSREMAESRSRIVAAADTERRRMERDLHDGAQQRLVLVHLRLGMLERLAAGDPDLVAGLAELRSDMAEAIAELRDLAHGIYPAVLENEGLGAALQQAAARAAIPTAVDLDGGIGRHSREIEAAVYFCCLEALQNAGKHAGEGASAVISLGRAAGSLHFSVCDTGAGFEGRASGHGIQNMQDRIGALGGSIRVTARRGAGTRVEGHVPVA